MRRFLSLDLLDNRYPHLHGIRVFAILTVVQFHVTLIFAIEQSIRLDRDWVISSLAIFFGMDLFFILSGFLIGTILLHAIDTAGLGKNTIRRFYLRRIFRTFPSYYLVLAFLVLVFPPTARQRQFLWTEWTYLTNYVTNDRKDMVMGWGWSLALEEQFYLVVPFLFWALQKLRSDRVRLAFLGTIWASALVVRLAIYMHVKPGTDIYPLMYFRTYTRYDTLICGIMLAIAHQRYREPIGRWLMDPFHRALVAMSSLFILWMLVKPWLFAGLYMDLFHVFAWGTLTTLMYTGFLTLLLHGHGVVHRFLSLPIFRSIATLGYGIYLVHIPLCDHVIVPAAHWMVARDWSLGAVWAISFVTLMVLSVAVAYALHVLVEKPALWVRDRIAR